MENLRLSTKNAFSSIFMIFFVLFLTILNAFAETGDVVEETTNEGYKIAHAYDPCRRCIPIEEFGDFNRVIIPDSAVNILYLCGWDGSITWPRSISYEFSRSDSVFSLNCCGESCAFDGENTGTRDTVLFRFVDGPFERIEFIGMTFQSFASTDSLIELFDAVSIFNFNKNIVKDISLQDLGSVIGIFPNDIGAVLHLGYNHFEKCEAFQGTIINNRFEGGGDEASGIDIVLRRNKFINNRALDRGGVLSLSDVTLSLYDNYFQGNSATRDIACAEDAYGGVIYISSSVIFSEGNHYVENFATTGGAAIFADDEVCLFSINDVFTGNEAGIEGCSSFATGGAIFILKGAMETKGNLYKNNKSFAGGSIFLIDVCAQSINDVHEANMASEFGGALVAEGSTFVSKKSIYRFNEANAEGAGAVGFQSFVGVGRFESYSDIFEGNSAIGDGGAIFLSLAAHKIQSSKFLRNTASGDGGGIISREAALTLKDCLFEDNTADGPGKDIFLSRSALKECGNTFNPERSVSSEESIAKELCMEDEL